MISADVVRALLALGLIAAQTREMIWIAFVCEIFLAGFSAFFEPASSAAVPNLVRKEDLARANIVMGAAWGTMLVVGAALGGLVDAVFGHTAAFVGDAASFAISAAILLRVRGRFHEKEPLRDASITIVEDVRETVRFARRERRVLALLVVKAGFGLSAGVIGLISVFAYKVFAAFGAFIAHAGGGSTWTLSTYGLMRFTPDAIRGRVFSFDYGLVTLTIAGSVFFAGLAAAHVDPRVVAAGIAGVALTWALVWTAWRRRLFRAATDRA
jgi:MFS family permease